MTNEPVDPNESPRDAKPPTDEAGTSHEPTDASGAAGGSPSSSESEPESEPEAELGTEERLDADEGDPDLDSYPG